MDLGSMFGKVKELQTKMAEAKAELANLQESAEVGAGMVKATVNGLKKVVSIDVDKEMFKPENQKYIQDLIVAAINKASDEIEIKASEELKKKTAGLMPNIPGFDLSNF